MQPRMCCRNIIRIVLFSHVDVRVNKTSEGLKKIIQMTLQKRTEMELKAERCTTASHGSLKAPWLMKPVGVKAGLENGSLSCSSDIGYCTLYTPNRPVTPPFEGCLGPLIFPYSKGVLAGSASCKIKLEKSNYKTIFLYNEEDILMTS